MKSHYIYIVLAAACLSCGQNKPKSGNAKCENSNLNDSILLQKYEAFLDKVEYINSDYDMKVLERIEKSRDTILLENFIKENYDIIKPYKEFSLIPKELVKYTYAIDFNGDSLLDIFYDGPTGAMPRISQIFLNLGTRYKKVFSEYQDIIKMDFINNKLHSFILNNEGCCADPQIVDYTYSVSYTDSIPKFEIIKAVGHLSRTEIVKNKLASPKEIRIIRDSANLRWVLSLKVCK